MLKKLAIVLLACASLQGCVVPFVAGAAVGGAAIYERKRLATLREDVNIHDLIFNRIRKLTYYDNDSHLSVSVFNHVVLLTGETTHAHLRQEVGQFARQTALVRRVYNEIVLSGPTSALTRSSDTWITTKIRSLMLGIKGLRSSQFKVVTENGVVYLMGLVTRSQADMAVGVARGVSGVQKVVKIFDYSN